MRVTLDGAGTTLRLDFGSDQTLRAFVADWRAKEGCLVRLSESMRLWTALMVELRLAGASQLELEARVVQVFSGQGGVFATALQATEPRILEEFARGEGPKTQELAAEAAVAAEAAAEVAAGAVGTSEMLGASPSFRIREMNVGQKMRLASRASVTERQILLRDSSPQVLMGLLANPRIEDKEVLVLAKSSAASGGVLQRIAKDRRWSSNYEIRLALVKNPQTPTPLALHMLEALRERDLRVLAKGSNVREAIRSAAVRKVVKRR